jgi:signal transduction histidine kinase/DNA-binding response OmpR family regulator
MTSQLLTAFDVPDIASILLKHISLLGIRHILAVTYSSSDEDLFANATILLDVGSPNSRAGLKILTRDFPPLDFYSSKEAFQLAILPFAIDEKTTGFVVLSATNLELCAVIVRNLAAALRNSQLYRDALEGRQLAEDANRLKSRFLSMVSHELRTPLSLIVGLSEMLLRKQSKLSELVLLDLEQINTSGEHLARLIGDVLDMATSEAGQLRILREPLDLKEVLQVVVKIGEQLAREKGLGWQANLPKRGTIVNGDLTRLRQITINLISNAVKFTPQGQVVLNVEIDGQTAIISVSDTGVGVSPTEQEKIFREFYRTEHAIQAGYGGLGLGLAITKQLLEQHGGHIGVRSPGDLGCGSTFFYTLPIISRMASQTELAAPLSSPANSVVVLTEKNDPAERLCNHLSERGFITRVFHVDKQIDWLSEVINSPPEALIFGNQLAARQGWVIMGMLKRQPATEHIPVLAYSIDNETDQGELLELNYLQKPLRLERLREELSHYSAPENGQLTILIVDDDPVILNMHSRLVEQISCRAITAGNGIEALKVIDKTKPDLILLDLMMPEMDGFAFMSALKKRETMRTIPVIVLTARVLSEEDLERLNNGVATILSKGIFSSGEILNRIEAALTRQHTLGQATQQIVRQAMAYIHTHFAEALSREDIARHVGISADYLTDCFRQELNITPMIYLRRYRILQARELLETTNLSMTQVAFEVGFSESAHFTRLFQREVGMTPRAYRHDRVG